MRLSQVVSKVAETEGGKVEVSVGNIREVFNRLATLIANDKDAREAWDKYVQAKEPKPVKTPKLKKEKAVKE